MQETKDNENMNDVGPTETGHLEEHGEEHIIYTSLPYLRNMTPRLTRLFNNAVKMKIANRPVCSERSLILSERKMREAVKIMSAISELPYQRPKRGKSGRGGENHVGYFRNIVPTTKKR
ncbi:hypothetical protein WA026_008855 [Henosepilachna vigintioctopunctata]|uniref:Uncharacterized protein n=1 Tax=Henosepilachna vigintioctopunctata TaxID=420089 RepID=A0AAW1VDA6_9CUCU